MYLIMIVEMFFQIPVSPLFLLFELWYTVLKGTFSWRRCVWGGGGGYVIHRVRGVGRFRMENYCKT